MKKTNRKDVIDKIKKLFRLSKSSNEHEAALALFKAKQLMDKLGIDESQLDENFLENEYNKDNVFEIKIESLIYNKRLPVYKDLIAAQIADFFSCISVRNMPIYKDNTVKYTVGLVGFEVDTIITKYAIEYTVAFIDKNVSKYYKFFKKNNQPKPKNFKLSYTIGILRILNEKLEILRKYKEQEQVNDTTTSQDNEIIEKMLVIKSNAIQEYMSRTYDLNGEHEPVKVNYNPDIADKGMNDAKNDFYINVPVNSHGTNKNIYLT